MNFNLRNTIKKKVPTKPSTYKTPGVFVSRNVNNNCIKSHEWYLGKPQSLIIEQTIRDILYTYIDKPATKHKEVIVETDILWCLYSLIDLNILQRPIKVTCRLGSRFNDNTIDIDIP